MSARWFLAAAMAAIAAAECANGCSGHGECGTNDQCECYDGFVGGDCSLRVCPMATAYVDTPRGDLNHDGKIGYLSKLSTTATKLQVASGYSKVQWSRFLQYESWPTVAATAAIDSLSVSSNNLVAPAGDSTSNIVGGWKAQNGEAHFMTECAGKGSCDRASGSCKCFEGYTGSACQRTTCPSDCSGHGVCRSIKEIAAAGAGKRFVESLAGKNVYAGMASPYDYRLWDSEAGNACVCDPGYGGIDCSLRQCPLGDDPLTTTEVTCGGQTCQDEIQAFSVDGNQDAGKYTLTFTDFNGVSFVTAPFTVKTNSPTSAEQKANAAAIEAALEALPNNVTGDVKVVADATYQGGAAGSNQERFVVTFSGKSGNIPDMVLGWDTADTATKRSYIFQPGQPIKTFSLTTVPAAADNLKFKVFPQDTTLFGLSSYWEGTAAVADTDGTAGIQNGEIGTAVAAALNAIPAIKLTYGAPFANDKNVLVTGTTTKTVLIAFPDKQFGANKVELYQAALAVAYAKDGADVVDGNKEAVMCSNRGICDFSTGLCKCFSGYTGVACDAQNILAM